MKSNWIIEVSDLNVNTPRGPILEKASLLVSRETIHVLVGPNGAGKSTLLRVLLGRIPFTGTVRIKWEANGAIGYVPQSFDLDKSLPLTIEELFALRRTKKPVFFGLGGARRRETRALLERVGLEPETFCTRLVTSLSGGELQRVLFANAIDPAPELLLLDEPTAALDRDSVERLAQELLRLRSEQRTTIVVVTHDLELARRIGDRVTRIERGAIRTGPAAEVLA